MKTLHVLIVDDFDDNIFYLEEVIDMLGYKVSSAKNGEIAVQKVANENFDVVLMDIEMPIMNGFEATQEIRTKCTHPKNIIPIVAISAHSQDFFKEKLEKSGFSAYIAKPYTADKITKCFKNLSLIDI
ncbi:MAG: response regulator [Bacteroidales bacterium]